MVEDLSPAIVGITNLQAQSNSSLFGSSSSDSSEDTESGSGSGVIFKKENGKAYIITNNHVVEGASSLKVSLYDGTEVTAKLVGSDSLTDLAVLQISDDHVTKVANFGDSSDLRTGETVIAIGDPLGKDLSRTVTQGIVSGVDRTVSMSTSAGETSINVIQTDAAINPGNSGGPLLNTDGKIVGINSMKISEDDVEGIGFAIPSNDVKPIAEELLSKGQIERPYIGVSMLDLEQVPQNYQEGTLGLFGSQLNKGVYIREVASGSPAEKAGLKAEDIIIGLFNGTACCSYSFCLRAKTQQDIVAGLDEKAKEYTSYKAKAKMTIETGSEPQVYNVEIWHKKPSLYRVYLENPKKDQNQVILRNENGVFVLTPSLNKSFRFQSDWPNNSSQVYLFESLVKDVQNDSDAVFTAKEKKYVFETKTNYQHNKMLPTQEITFNKKI